MQVFHSLALEDGQDITALALNSDNKNLLVSTADKQLIVFTDPNVSVWFRSNSMIELLKLLGRLAFTFFPFSLLTAGQEGRGSDS